MLKYLIRDNIIVVVLVLACLFFALAADNFLTLGNARNIAINSAILAAIVVPGTLLIISGQIDLSVGSITGLAGTLTALAASQWGWSPVSAMSLGLATGAAVGAVNGVLCAVLGFNAIVVTLGMLSVIRGATLMTTTASLYGLGESFAVVGRGAVFGVPIIVIVALAIFAVGGIFLRFSPWGRHIYAIGVNREAAFLAGLPVRLLPFLLYLATGVAAGVAGLMSVSRLDGAAPAQLGINLELLSLTAILVGGVAFAGGRGSLSGVFFAVLLLGVLQNGLVLLNVPPFVQMLATGLLLVIAASIDVAWTALSRLSGFRISRKPDGDATGRVAGRSLPADNN